MTDQHQPVAPYTDLYAEELTALNLVLGYAYLAEIGDGATGIVIPIGTLLTETPHAMTITLTTAPHGLADTREAVLHWLATVRTDDGRTVAIGHHLSEATEAATEAIINLHHRDTFENTQCPCLTAAAGDYAPFTPEELAEIRADYRRLLTEQRDNSSAAVYFDTVEEMAAEITLRDGVIVHHNARGSGHTIQFIRRHDRQRLRAFDADRYTVIAEWPQGTLTADLINDAWDT